MGPNCPKGPTSPWCRDDYQCPVAKAKPISQYLFFLLEVYDLIEAGYPFEKNDLSYHEWLDLSYLKQHFKDHKSQENLRQVSLEMLKLVQSSSKS